MTAMGPLHLHAGDKHTGANVPPRDASRQWGRQMTSSDLEPLAAGTHLRSGIGQMERGVGRPPTCPEAYRQTLTGPAVVLAWES